MLERLKIGARLGLGFGTLIVVATATFIASVLVGLQGQRATERTDATALERIQLVETMRVSQLRLVSAIRSAGLQTDAGQVMKDVEVYRDGMKSLVVAEAAFAAMPTRDDERALLDKSAALRRQAEPVVDEAIRFTMAFAGDQAAKLLSEKFAPLEKQWSAILVELSDAQHKRAQQARADIAAAGRERLTLLALLLLGSIGVAVLLARATTLSVTRPLRQAAQVAASIAEGNLDVTIDSRGNDEAADMLRSLRTMATQLAAMVSAVQASAVSIEVASREITQGNADLSARTQLQAASAQQTSASLEGLTEMVDRTSGHARTVRSLTDRTHEVAERSNQAMDGVAKTMSRISESSRRIAEIIGVIDGIAFQTNILALNAAVEAARAGEQGRGFTVVASEVRALAQRVTTAAAEVRTLIAESVDRVDEGARQVGGMNTTMAELQQSVDQVRTLITDISAATSEQSTSISEVNQAMRTIDESTQRNSALVHEVTSTAQSLSEQTERLTSLVRRFRLANA